MSERPATAGDGTRRQRALAWGVHMFTATGVALAILAWSAIDRHLWTQAMLWLFIALLVDGVDGTLARAAHVKTRLPRIDGNALDLVIDYLNYVFLPVIFILEAGHLPGPWALPLAAAILMSSLYVFARADMKTDDGYFRGFPALWNIVAFYFYVAPPTPFVAVLTIVVLVVMTFAPIHVVHPFRVRDYGLWLPGLATFWAAVTAALLVPGLGWTAWVVLVGLSLGAAGILLLLGLARSRRPARA